MMRVFQAITFRTTSKENVGEVVARVSAAVEAAGETAAPRFYLADSPLGGVSAVSRIAKRHPELAPLASSGNLTPGMQGAGFMAMTNLGREWNRAGGDAEPPDVAPDVVQEIAAGIPRSFPLNAATFVWPQLNILTVAGDGSTVKMTRPIAPTLGMGPISPSVIFSSNWWINGRLNGLMAYVEVAADARPTPKLELPPATLAFVNALGKVKQHVLIPLPDAAEAADANDRAMRLRQINVAWRSDLAQRLAAVTFPHDLPTAAELGHRSGATIGPLKEISVAAFSPLGFKAASGGQGMHALKKTTASGNTLDLSIDVGTWSHSCSVILTVQCFGAGLSMPIPVNRRDIGMPQYPIQSQAQFRQMMENAAAAVRYLESTFVVEVERAAG